MRAARDYARWTRRPRAPAGWPGISRASCRLYGRPAAAPSPTPASALPPTPSRRMSGWPACAPPSMSYVLGVDAGNTKTVALVARLDGTVVGAGRAGCGDIYGLVYHDT